MNGSNKLRWVAAAGGAMGPKRLLMVDDHYVGHFYEDASEGVIISPVLEEV